MGNKTQTTTGAGSTTPNATALNAYNALIANTSNLAQTPYAPYGGQGVAPVNAEQTQGINNINAYANAAQPAIGSAIGLVQNAANPLTANQIQQYYSPFQQNVVNTTEQAFANTNAQQQEQLRGNDIAQGALGGNRSAVGQAVLAGQQQASEAPVLAGLENTGYNQAVQYAMQQFQQNPENAAFALGNLGVAGENAGLTGANAEIGAGTLQQQTQQAKDVFNYQQYLNQNAYPFQLNQYAAGIDTGVGSNMGGYSTNSATYPGPSLPTQLAGLGIAGIGAANLFGIKDGGRVEGLATGGAPYGGGDSYLPGPPITPGRGAPPAQQLQIPQQQSPMQMIQGASSLAKLGGSGSSGGDFSDRLSDWEQDNLGLMPGDTEANGGRIMPRADGGLALPTQNRINVSALHDHLGKPVRAGLGMPSFMGRRGFDDGGGINNFQYSSPEEQGARNALRNLMSIDAKYPKTRLYTRQNMAQSQDIEDKVRGFDDGGNVPDPSFNDRFTGEALDSLAMQSALRTVTPPENGQGTPVAGVSAPATPPPDAIQNAQAAAPQGLGASPAAPDEITSHYSQADRDYVNQHQAPDALPPEVTTGRSRPTLNARERDAVIKTVYGEAGNQAPIGQAAVASVILNRQQSGKWGNSAAGVVTAPYQFEPWNTQEGRSRMNTMSPQDYARIGNIVDKVYAGEVSDPTGGATHFFAPGAQHALGRADPEWGRSGGLKIGDHLFFKPDDPNYAPGKPDATATAFSDEPPTAGLQPLHMRAPSASTSDSTASTAATPAEHKGFLGLSHDASQSLLAAGLGIMASRSPFAGVAIGEGGLTGLAQFGALRKQNLAEKSEADQADYRAKSLQRLADAHMDLVKHQTAMENEAARKYTDMTAAEKAALVQGRVPPGYRAGADGKLEAIPGGPADPETIKADARAKTGAAELPDEDARALAERYVVSGNRMVMSGLGYGNTGAVNRAKVQTAINQVMKERDISNEEMANREAEWEGRKAGQRVLGTQEAKMGSAAFEAKGAITLARGAIEKVPRTSFLPLNKLIQGYQTQTLNPDQAELLTRNQGIINTYAAVMARGANVTTDSARDRGEKLLNTAANPESLNRVYDTMESEINMAIHSPQQMREFYRKQYGEKALTAEDSSATAAPQGGGHSAQDTAALNWANANPNDPRAAQIKKKLGVQ